MSEFMSGHPTAHSWRRSVNAKVKQAAEVAFLAKLSALFRKLKTKQNKNKTKWGFLFFTFWQMLLQLFSPNVLS